MLPLTFPTICLALAAGVLAEKAEIFVREGGLYPDTPDATISAPSRIACSAKCAALEEWRCGGFWYQANGTCLLYQEKNTISEESSIYRRHSDEYHDCSDLPPGSPSGVYLLRPGSVTPAVPAYCDMDTDGGGWTLVLRRADIEPRVDFLRDWQSYKLGLGSLDGEFYWGNEYLWLMTSHQDREYEAHIWLEGWDGSTAHALYQNFVVESEAVDYRLTLGAYSGDAGDSFSYNSNKPFSTTDRGNTVCVDRDGAGWWYASCTLCQLTGKYIHGGHSGYIENGIVWRAWKSSEPFSMKGTVMKIRPSKKL